MNKNPSQLNTCDIFNIAVNKGLIKDIPYRMFYDVVREFHKEISKKIVEGYRFRPGHSLGTFYITKDLRKGYSIDWGSSNKRKAELITEGKIPYDKETAPDGEKWFIFYVDNLYFKWKWSQDTATHLTRNLKHYMFDATTGNRKSVGKAIKRMNNTTEPIIDKYVSYK